MARQAIKKMFVGIDPDADRSGVATLETLGRECIQIDAETKTFPQLCNYLQAMRDICADEQMPLLVVVEGGWLNVNFWHLAGSDNRNVAAKKGWAVGRNHQVGLLLVQMCRHYGIDVTTPKPLQKVWHGHDRKISEAEITQFMPLTGRHNQEARDAALLAWVAAGLPIKISTRQKH